MTVFVPLALFGWIPLTFVIFALLPPRRAVLVALVTGWLFLPVATYPIAGFIDYSKTTAVSLGILLAVGVFDRRRLFAFRPMAVDVPVAIWSFCPMAASLSNGLGFYDGLSGVASHILIWGIPYLLGRIYFQDRNSLRELAVAIVIGGLVYVPLCLFEIRMSPQLHSWIYGFRPTPFMSAQRYGGFRPSVFMVSSLMVGMWMASATVTAFWLWRTKLVRRILHVPIGWLVALLVVVTVLGKTVGAATLMLVGCGLYYPTKVLRTRVFLLALLAVGALYAPLRASETLKADQIVSVVGLVYDPLRLESLAFRLRNEGFLLERALRRPWLGWGGWKRGAIVDEQTGRNALAADGMWIITLGRYGFLGLASLIALYLLPGVLLMRRPARHWVAPEAGASAALTTVVVLYWADSLTNAFSNPILLLTIGALCRGRSRARARRGGPGAFRGPFSEPHLRSGPLTGESGPPP